MDVGAAAVAAARAGQLRSVADDVRHQGQRALGTTSIDWRSPAAGAFRTQACELGLSGLDLARRIDEAAEALERHAVVAAGRFSELEDFLRRLPTAP
ncbi:MAG TPA: hypothetical protein VFD41_13360 [Actinomycetales bacterium]|nr:hypothetical protein [Actinomycetales bacterium]